MNGPQDSLFSARSDLYSLFIRHDCLNVVFRRFGVADFYMFEALEIGVYFKALNAQEIAGAVAIEVSDTGAGIAPEEIRTVTRRFVRGRRVAPGGSGLGLAIAGRYCGRSWRPA